MPATCPRTGRSSSTRTPHIRPVARASHAAALLVVGRPDEAVAAYDEVLGAMGEIGGMDLAALTYLGEVGLAIGDADGCRTIRDAIPAPSARLS